MRTSVYIDGFNLYYGALQYTEYKWLNPKQLCETILKPHHEINSIVYCTAKVKPRPTDQYVHKRQAVYIEALKSYVPELRVIYGHFLVNKKSYKSVDKTLGNSVEVYRPEEKGSDVNLAVNMLNDAHNNRFDCAVVISNDSGLAEAMRLVKDECEKVVGLLTPSRRRVSKQLMKYSDFQRMIRKTALANSQLPDTIPGSNIRKPQNW